MSADLGTIWGLCAALREHDAELPVFIDNVPPTALASYRGYYDHLAIARREANHPETGFPPPVTGSVYGYTPGHLELRIKTPATVGELAHALFIAVTAEFEGYKGGRYAMDADTPLWVSEWGQVDRLRVAAIEALPGRVDLVTREVAW